ncbi:LUD domain-containing protein (plasmid) [Halarchaeum sp. CBA1220]|uniref:LUD domain-containing protein n=1 Tax=Halarchaeum sp. CBA1220 TaxID=1853682 RepID=UPI000F3A8E53|nr:LUD domain-containing protein [Halarchaeum sp. CBA1220]QLC34762.1 LUD domain-containing protein [Halarchaeum sp. CBA1220]
MSTALSTFESSLDRLEVGWTRTTPDGFGDALASAIDPPAVGVPLGIDGVSLDGTAVETPPTPRLLREANTGVTRAGKAIARYGTLVVDSDPEGTEPVSLYPPTHVAVVRESDVLPDVESASDHLGARFADGGSSVFATGVSSTGDMGALVEGVHGPKHVHVLILEER